MKKTNRLIVASVVLTVIMAGMVYGQVLKSQKHDVIPVNPETMQEIKIEGKLLQLTEEEIKAKEAQHKAYIQQSQKR